MDERLIEPNRIDKFFKGFRGKSIQVLGKQLLPWQRQVKFVCAQGIEKYTVMGMRRERTEIEIRLFCSHFALISRNRSSTISYN